MVWCFSESIINFTICEKLFKKKKKLSFKKIKIKIERVEDVFPRPVRSFL